MEDPVGDPPKPEEDPVDVAEVVAATGAREHRVFTGKLGGRRSTSRSVLRRPGRRPVPDRPPGVPGLPAGAVAAAPARVRVAAGARLLGGLVARPGGILVPAVAIAAVELALVSEVGHGGWGLGGYALFLLCGYLTAADPRVGQAFQRHWRPAAVLGLLLFVATGVAAFAALDARLDPFTGMVLYDLGVRRHPVTRFLFGLKPQPSGMV